MIPIVCLSDSEDEPMTLSDKSSRHSGVKMETYSDDDPSIEEEEGAEHENPVAPLENGHYFMAAEEQEGYQPIPPSEHLIQINARCDQLNQRDWSKIPKYLKEWRQNIRFPTPSDRGEPSNARQLYPLTHEPPHDTVPLLAAVAHDQERRLDRMEIQIMEQPNHGEYMQLANQVHAMETRVNATGEQVFTLGHQLGIMRGGVQGLMRREEEMSGCIYNMGDRLGQTMRHVDVA